MANGSYLEEWVFPDGHWYYGLPSPTVEEIRAMTNAEFSAYIEKLCRAKGTKFVRDRGKRRAETWTATWQDNDGENLSEHV